jgi:hypothetical protein
MPVGHGAPPQERTEDPPVNGTPLYGIRLDCSKNDY